MTNNLVIDLSRFTTKMAERKFMNERSLLIEELFKEVDKEQKDHYFINGVKKKKQKLTPKSLAVILSKQSINQLTFLKSICNDYRSRGGSYEKCLRGAIKIR